MSNNNGAFFFFYIDILSYIIWFICTIGACFSHRKLLTYLILTSEHLGKISMRYENRQRVKYAVKKKNDDNASPVHLPNAWASGSTSRKRFNIMWIFYIKTLSGPLLCCIYNFQW